MKAFLSSVAIHIFALSLPIFWESASPVQSDLKEVSLSFVKNPVRKKRVENKTKKIRSGRQKKIAKRNQTPRKGISNTSKTRYHEKKKRVFFTPSPKYPQRARELQLQGKTVFLFNTDKNGRPRDLKLIKSSGHSSLDNSARITLKTWRISENLKSIKVPFVFKLNYNSQSL